MPGKRKRRRNMHERLEQVLKLVCVLFAALVLYQLARIIFRPNPLAHLSFPAIPSLPAPETNSPSAKPAIAAKPGLRKQNARRPTNAAATPKPSTNPMVSHPVGPASGLSVAHPTAHNAMAATPVPNSVAFRAAPSPLPAAVMAHGPVGMAMAGPAMRGPMVMMAGGRPPGMPPGMAMIGGPPMGMPMGPMAAPKLPKEIKSRVERITDSEILAPVIHPMPTALLGIIGDTVFLRASNGQSGPVTLGKELGGVKLLKIGINRVLVEEAGQKKELTIFSGFGGHSLISNDKEKPHEPSRK
jgi:hypothetical protein